MDMQVRMLLAGVRRASATALAPRGDGDSAGAGLAPLSWVTPCYGIAHGVACCFKYLHHSFSKPLIHRDLKPDNVLVAEDYTAKVADFGEATHFDVERARELGSSGLTMTMVGTALYCAPEILAGLRYNEKCDCYSYALLLYELWAGRRDLVLTERRGVSNLAVVEENWRPLLPDTLREGEPKLCSLIERAWAADFLERPSFAEIFAQLEACKPIGATVPSGDLIDAETAPQRAKSGFSSSAVRTTSRVEEADNALDERRQVGGEEEANTALQQARDLSLKVRAIRAELALKDGALEKQFVDAMALAWAPGDD